MSNVAWTYEQPKPGYEALTGHLAFYAGKVDEAWLGDEQATPAAGPLLRRVGHLAHRRSVQGRAGHRGLVTEP